MNDNVAEAGKIMRFYLNDTAHKNGITALVAPAVGDAGYDVRSNEYLVVHPGEQALVSTGLHVEIPPGMVGVLKDRSSMARQGLRVSGGVIDSTYRGEIKVVLENRGLAPFTIHVNDRIVQMLIVPIYTSEPQQVEKLEDLSTSERGQAGFGSTGRQ